MALSYAQLKSVWLSAAQGTQYATNAWASLMAAIAEAESSGNPNSTNPTDNGGTQTSWGLWQISLGNHDEPSPNWNDPVVNAQLAIGKLEGQGLSAWGTYTSGAYKTYLNGATTPDGTGIQGGSAVDAAQLTAAAAVASNCLWSIPTLGSVIGSTGGGIIGGFIGGITGNPSAGVSQLSGSGGYCIFSRSEARGLVGAGLLVGGGLVILWGVQLLTVLAGLKAAGSVISTVTGAKSTATRGAGLFGGGAGAGTAAAGEGAAAGGAADVAVLAA
jgi:hypothetical protein